MKTDRRVGPVTLAALCNIALGGMAFAAAPNPQESAGGPPGQAPTPPPTAAADQAFSVGEIIVTAQRRSERIQEVPAAISAISGQTLANRGVTSASDLQSLAPSLQVGRLLGQTAIAIRGVGLNQGSPGVAIHVDGVYQPRASMGDLAQADLARVEILRGPQGTLYGRNANGGVVNFITSAPTEHYSADLLGSYASYEESRLRAVLNAPLGPRVRSRLVVDSWRRGEGFVENVRPGGQDLDKGKTLAGRLRTAIDLTDSLDLDLTVNALNASGPTSYFTLYSRPTPTAVANNPYLVGAVIPTGRKTALDNPVDDKRDFASVAATLSWKLGNFSLKSISAYQYLKDNERRDDDGTNLNAFPAAHTAKSDTYTQEFNLSGNVANTEGAIGAFYMHDDAFDFLRYDFPLGLNSLPPGSFLSSSAPKLLTKTVGVFGDATMHVSDRFRLIGGLRWSEDKVSLDQSQTLTLGGVFAVPSCPKVTNSVKFSSFTPRVGAQYDLSDNSNAYATYSEGFKSGGWNIYGCSDQFLPETIESYELGWKNRFLDGRLIANLSLFSYNYTNLQLAQVVGLATLIQNAPKATIKGLELETALQPDAHLRIDASVSVLDATYDEFNNLDSANPTAGFQDVSGNRLNNAPKLSVNFGASYRTDETSIGRFTLQADVSYRSRIYFREFNAALDSQKAYTVVNSSLIWDSRGEKYRIRLFANNLFDELYIARMGSADSFGARYVTYGGPRQIGIELSSHF